MASESEAIGWQLIPVGPLPAIVVASLAKGPSSGFRACRIISVDERADIIEALDADAYKVSAGGSLSNSLVALSRLGNAAERQSLQPAGLRVAMAGVDRQRPAEPLLLSAAAGCGRQHHFPAGAATAAQVCSCRPVRCSTWIKSPSESTHCALE